MSNVRVSSLRRRATEARQTAQTLAEGAVRIEEQLNELKASVKMYERLAEDYDKQADEVEGKTE